MLNYCCLFHKYDVVLTPYCETTFELAATFNCLERQSPNASSTVYHSAISTFLEPHHPYKASDHPVYSKLMHHFCLQDPPSHKCFDPWDVECLLSLLESWSWVSSLTTFKLAWKTGTLLALVTLKCCSDLTLLCIDNQHFFFSIMLLFSFPCLVARWIIWVIFLLRFVFESHSNVNLCPVFIWSLFETYWTILDEAWWITCNFSFLGNNRQHRPVCAKTISSWVSKVLCIAKTHMSPGSLHRGCSLSSQSFLGVHSAVRWLGLQQLDTIFPSTLLLQTSTWTLYSMLC